MFILQNQVPMFWLTDVQNCNVPLLGFFFDKFAVTFTIFLISFDVKVFFLDIKMVTPAVSYIHLLEITRLNTLP